MNAWERMNQAAAFLAEDLKTGLVQVAGMRGNGAGTIWHPDGLIVTNAHVARGERLTVVLHDARRYAARVMAVDRERDLAALVADVRGLPAVALGDSRDLSPGRLVFALGHPWGIQDTIMAGTVIGVGRAWPEMPWLRGEWVAVDIPLRPGNSGGALVDADGRLVGINTMINGPDVGIAVPVNVAKGFLKEAFAAVSAVA